MVPRPRPLIDEVDRAGPSVKTEEAATPALEEEEDRRGRLVTGLLPPVRPDSPTVSFSCKQQRRQYKRMNTATGNDIFKHNSDGSRRTLTTGPAR